MLKQANLVVDRAVGTRRLYALNPDAFDSLRDYFNQLWTQALAAFKQAAEAQPREDEEDA